MNTITASWLGRAISCPASREVPQGEKTTNDAAERGKAIHAYLQDVVCHSKTYAMLKVADEYVNECKKIDTETIEGLWHGSVYWQAETPFCYNALTGISNNLPDVHSRNYPPATSGEIFGTLDLVAFYERNVVVVDYKTGRKYGSCEENWQMRFAAIAATRLAESQGYTIDSTKMVLAYLKKSGKWDLDEYVADVFDIDAWCRQLRSEMMRTDFPAYPSDSLCRYCPSKTHCNDHY